MATKITITADASQAKQELNQVAGSFGNLQQDAVDASNRAADAMEALVDELRDARLEATKTDKELEKIGGAGLANRITALATSFTAITQALRLGQRAAREALHAIEFMADSGSPAAIRLRDSITEVQDALIRLADDPAIQNLGDRLAGMAERAAEGILDLPDLWRAAVNRISDDIVLASESLGLMAEGTIETLDEMQAADERAVQSARDRTAAEREANKAAEEAKKLAEERAKLEKQAAEEQEQAELDAFNDSLRMDDEEFQQKNAHIAELVRNQEAANARILESERELHAQRERDEQERIAKQKAALQGTGVLEGVNRAAADPQAIARRLAQQAAEAKMSEIYQGGGDVDSAANKRAIEEARRAAHRAAIQQSRGGREAFSQEQIADAITQNASAGIQAMQETGQFSQESLTALSEAAAEQRRMATEMQAMQDQLAEIRRFQAGTAQDGQRRRSQRNSNRQ